MRKRNSHNWESAKSTAGSRPECYFPHNVFIQAPLGSREGAANRKVNPRMTAWHTPFLYEEQPLSLLCGMIASHSVSQFRSLRGENITTLEEFSQLMEQTLNRYSPYRFRQMLDRGDDSLADDFGKYKNIGGATIIRVPEPGTQDQKLGYAFITGSFQDQLELVSPLEYYASYCWNECDTPELNGYAESVSRFIEEFATPLTKSEVEALFPKLSRELHCDDPKLNK